MSPHAAIAVGPREELVVAVDGPEVIAWDGRTLQPVWQAVGDARYRGVAIDAGRVWLLDERGFLEARRTDDGGLLHRGPALEVGGTRIAARGGHVAVASPVAVAWRHDGAAVGDVDVDGAVGLALDADGRLAILDRHGVLLVVDLVAGRALARITVGGTPGGVAARPGGGWLVAAGGHLVDVGAGGDAVRRVVAIEAVGAVGLVGGGALALVAGPRRIDVVDVVARRALGHVALGRDVAALAVGEHARAWLAVGHGDVQRLDLAAGSADVAVPPRGRTRTTWPVDVRVDAADVRGAIARHATGGGPIARRRVHEAGGGRRWWRWALAATALVGVGVGAWWALG